MRTSTCIEIGVVAGDDFGDTAVATLYESKDFGVRRSDGQGEQRRQTAHRTKTDLSAADVTTAKSIHLDESPEWQAEFTARLVSLSKLTDYEAITGVAAPNQIAIWNAYTALIVLFRIGLQPSRIDPSSDEGVCISFAIRDKYADIECFNTGDVMAAHSGGSEASDLWRVQSDKMIRAASKIQFFLREA